MTRRRQSQEEANAYWADKDVKKWTVEFSCGPRHKRVIDTVYVSARDAASARRGGLAGMLTLGRRWARRATCSVRLATAQDLGCVYVGTEGGAECPVS